METTLTTIPDAILVEILATFPLRSIAGFKLVCKSWKSVIESSYFRRVFASLHQNSSPSWSIMFPTVYHHTIKEVISFHGCETWNLPKPLASYIIPPNLPNAEYLYVASSNGLIWIDVTTCSYKSFVGNPVLQQWVEIPPPPCPCATTGLVTRVDEDGVVSGFKVVRTCQKIEARDRGMYVRRVYVYSSDTGLWTFKRLLNSRPVNHPPVNINGMLYLWERRVGSTKHGVIVAHDFYGPEADDNCQVIPLPDPSGYQDVKSCLTTSGGDVIYIARIYQILKLWKMNKNSENGWWQLSREINMPDVMYFCFCIPMAMNPFDNDIVYLWSQKHHCLVTGNLRTQEFTVHQESEKWTSSEGWCRINTCDSKGYIDHDKSLLILSQFVFQRLLPRPQN
ncbi:hypothetical protein ARALYDRAFT_891924 [Arabidopsis lyrata subsp. lyrata]|uniref:F-box domain-containing protein n=1 Tax=Arabidopsis lyrata subsp. lyrata TaxID=81972 RepID=D7KFU4_ARALL|nr:F-box protein At1g49990 [Arabidopsis lyrata subsp. lyrata]EFH67808.1 hypothetical protein ARALYDRAFT_891924 [Arabidopsis lyrata subsp. lyrata]|eukprot:XP_002891549.1 F-box protein At1g49990 [Arabidopsis lyrata subsp. lyrata]